MFCIVLCRWSGSISWCLSVWLRAEKTEISAALWGPCGSESILPTTRVGSYSFYRAMHYSAKRGIAIACCPSVCLSVTLVDHDHIGWKAWKLLVITRTISPTPSLYVLRSPKDMHLLRGEHGETRGGWKKVVCWSTKAAISLKRVHIEEKLLWGPIETY